MKSKTFIKLKSLILLILIVVQTIYPTAAFALADNPIQSDFASYENFSATDMVNLATGDFTYNIPLVHIPSPEGGYQIPLSYHAGIELNEESSWVGLGWSLNPGALTRNVSVVPDDYSHKSVTTAVSGVGSNGNTYVYPFGSNTYDSDEGEGGSIGLLGVIDFGWGNQEHFGIAPLGLTAKDGVVTYDSEYMVSGLLASASLAGMFFSGPLGVGLSVASAAGTAVNNYLKPKQQSSPSSVGMWSRQWTITPLSMIVTQLHYQWVLSGSTTNYQYGSLYLGNTTYDRTVARVNAHNLSWSAGGNLPDDRTSFETRARRFNIGTASDMYMASDNYGKDPYPTSISYDNYSIKAPNVSGSIKPYRQDIGSLSNGRSSGEGNNCYFVGPAFLSPTDYKVQFKYDGDFSNSTTFQLMPNDNTLTQQFPCELDLTQGAQENFDFKLLFKDPKVYVNYAAVTGPTADESGGAYSNNYYANLRTEANRTGLQDRNLVHGRHIEWFTNSEIIAGTAASKGFINSHQVPVRTGMPGEGIGGFSITNESGITYHFTIPVYNKDENTFSASTSPVVSYETTNSHDYATMWLLTGITGSDYVDRGTIGVVDNQDYGYWVQFDYGKFAENYNWRNPYYGKIKKGNFDLYKTGVKQTYFLNRISTRTHTALFIKSAKKDGKSFYKQGTGSDIAPSSSLKLDNIYVLANEDYEKLIAPSGSGGIGLVTTSTTNNNQLRNGDTYATVLDNYDVSAGPVQSFLTANQLQKLSFTYDYELCPKTFNSFDLSSTVNPPAYNPDTYPTVSSDRGKLTLKSVSYFGKNNFRILPSYLFDYTGTITGHNPDYHPYKWDGYGMYKSGGTGPENTPHTAEKRNDFWSLKKITTPLGAEISIEYERDDYSSVNGALLSESPLKLNPNGYSGTSVTFPNEDYGATTYISDLVKVGQNVKITYFSGMPLSINTADFTVASAGQYGLTLSGSFNPSGKTIVDFAVVVDKKYGGNVRVKNITTKDENNNQFTAKYVYTMDGLEAGVSSGVASYETEYDHGILGDFYFYRYADHPYTPIMYSKVTVIDGQYGAVFNETSKKVFHFVTPHKNMIEQTYSPNIDRYQLRQYGNITNNVYAGQFNTIDKTSMIGLLDTVKIYNKYGNLSTKTVYEYTDNRYAAYYQKNIGTYAENTFLWEDVITEQSGSNYTFDMRVLSSCRVKLPAILKGITTYKDRLVSSQEITDYDYLTGQPLKTINTYGDNEKYEQSIIPLYQLQGMLGSKVLSNANKNIMFEAGETHSYVYDKNNQKKRLGSSIMKYDGGLYREFNGGTGEYQSLAGSYTAKFPFQTYKWKSVVDEDGTVNSATFFNFPWSGSIDPRYWVKTSEVTLYDHYSHILELKDMDNKYHSQKYGYNNSFPVATCSNARYDAWCYSGAEDKSSESNYYCGEVKGSNYQHFSSFYSHTGNFCSRIAQEEVGFSYKLPLSSVPAMNGHYRASVWVHQEGVSAAYLSCTGLTANGTANAVLATSSSPVGYTNSNYMGTIEKAGDFYILNIDVNLAQVPLNTTHLLFEVKNFGYIDNQPYIYVDDFRVHPLSTPIQSTVYDSKSGKLLASLDKENYAMKYEYDNGGKLKTVYKETKIGFRRVAEKNYHYNRNN